LRQRPLTGQRIKKEAEFSSSKLIEPASAILSSGTTSNASSIRAAIRSKRRNHSASLDFGPHFRISLDEANEDPKPVRKASVKANLSASEGSHRNDDSSSDPLQTVRSTLSINVLHENESDSFNANKPAIGILTESSAEQSGEATPAEASKAASPKAADNQAAAQSSISEPVKIHTEQHAQEAPTAVAKQTPADLIPAAQSATASPAVTSATSAASAPTVTVSKPSHRASHARKPSLTQSSLPTITEAKRQTLYDESAFDINQNMAMKIV
jgi:hypothetical protein